MGALQIYIDVEDDDDDDDSWYSSNVLHPIGKTFGND